MAISAVTAIQTIRCGHVVREEFSGQSTGSIGFVGRTGYYRTKGHAINAFSGALQCHDMWLDCDDLSDFHGDSGRKTIDVYADGEGCIGSAILMWYRMPSGNYEFIGYLT